MGEETLREPVCMCVSNAVYFHIKGTQDLPCQIELVVHQSGIIPLAAASN